MTAYEPKSVTALLRNSSLVAPNERVQFQANWSTSVSKRVKTWSDLPSQKKSPRSTAQLTWEAEVVEYVNLLWQKTRPRSKKTNIPSPISLDVPFFGPRFVPPTYLHDQKRSGLSTVTPNVQYLKAINVIHPLYYPDLACCPQCQSRESVTWEGWTATGARELHGISLEEVALGLQLRCSSCKAELKAVEREATAKQGGTDLGENDSESAVSSYCFATTNAVFWRSWEHWKMPRGLLIFFHRCAFTRELWDLIVELRPSSTSGGMAEQVKQLHLLEYQHRRFEYLEQVQRERSKPKSVASYFGKGGLQLNAFSSYADPQGYAGRSVSDEMISEAYLSFVSRTRQQESDLYLRTLTAVCGSLDSTFKISNKASLTDKDCQRSKQLKGGILSILNEENQIISWRFCQSKSNAEIVEILTGLKRRIELLGQAAPEMMVSDNCCAVRNAVLAVFPEVDSIQDVWHFIARYLATIMHASRNPLRSAVMADITDAILKKHAKAGDSGAEYWSRTEQEKRLTAAFEKWSENGTVWSAASLKVHQEQLKHVRKGCLERRREDVLSDGSRIEGCHKAWNSLQRAQPSGLVMLTALSHDFVLRRNVRIAFSSEKASAFVLSTQGSHHLHLVCAIAQLHNQLRALEPESRSQILQVPMLPELHAADSGELFGLIKSKHSSTFGGLLKKEETTTASESANACSYQPESDEDDIAIRALHISQDILFNEWHIDPALLDQPASLHHDHAPTLRLPPVASALPSRSMSTKPSIPAATGATSESLANTTHTSTDTEHIHPTQELTAAASLKRKVDMLCAATSEGTLEHRDNGRATLDKFFKPKSRRLDVTTTKPDPVQPPNSDLATCATEPSSVEFTLPEAVFPTTATVMTTAGDQTAQRTSMPTVGPVTVSLSSNLSTRRTQCVSGETRSQRLFAIATGIPPESLTINGNGEFYLFMEMRAENGWISYQMSSQKWVEATAEYNRHLAIKFGPNVIKKNPQALLRLLGRMETRLIERIANDDYKSKRNSEVFWRHHCSVIPLIKTDSAGTRKRKVPTCTRCQTIMYPGPTKATINHKKGICADGVKTKPTDDEPLLPPWPQPRGIFSGGMVFHTNAFLKTVKQVYDQFIGGEPPGAGENALLILEAQAFVSMLQARTVVLSDNGGAPIALFKLYSGFKVDGSTPNSRVIERDGASWLRINYLEEDSEARK